MTSAVELEVDQLLLEHGEYTPLELLLRSGRLIFYPSTSREAVVVDNVINVNHVEDRIKDLLSVVAVRMSEHQEIE